MPRQQSQLRFARHRTESLEQSTHDLNQHERRKLVTYLSLAKPGLVGQPIEKRTSHRPKAMPKRVPASVRRDFGWLGKLLGGGAPGCSRL
ncbi:MAG TPA: hypothetical protein PKW66_24655 [Polyangiaceae bacterium]|nr:hypothetical protein [Polyangiaceae bacterium]